MMDDVSRRGGAPVGYLTELPEIEVGAVLYLRLWCCGPDTQAQVWGDFAAGLGPDQGRIALKAFEMLCAVAVKHGRRPLMRHDVGCKCLGADESVFANFVAAAASGEREDAMLFASLLVRPEMALTATTLAEQFGLALRRMLLRADPQPGTHHQPTHHLH